MDVRDLIKLRNHVDVAIAMAERGGLIDMSEVEKMAFKEKFGDADMVIGNFIIKMCSVDQEGPVEL